MKISKLASVAAIVALTLVSTVRAENRKLWAVDSTKGQLVNLDPFTGVESNRLNLPSGSINTGDTQIGLSGWGTELFYVDSDISQSKVSVISPTDGSIIRTFNISGGWAVNGLGFFQDPITAPNGSLYTSGCSVGDMHKYAATDGSNPSFFWGGSTVKISEAVGGDFGGRIYAPLTGQQEIVQVDPINNSVIKQLNCTFAADIVGMAYDGAYLYAGTIDKKLFTLNPDTGAIVNSLDVPYVMYGLGSTEGSGKPLPVVPLPSAAFTGISLLGVLGAIRAAKATRA